MAETEKPNWGNRVILLIFIALGLITIAGTIISTMEEWNADDVAGPQAVEGRTVIDPSTTSDQAPTPPEADTSQGGGL